jgi:hypothetical protein
MPTPTFSLDFEKVGIEILVIDFQENILMNSGRFQNLLNNFLFNLIRHSTLYDLPFQNYDQSKTSRKVTVWQSYVSIMNTNGTLQKVFITSMTDWWLRTFHVRIQPQVEKYFFRLLHISILFLWKKIIDRCLLDSFRVDNEMSELRDKRMQLWLMNDSY